MGLERAVGIPDENRNLLELALLDSQIEDAITVEIANGDEPGAGARGVVLLAQGN